MTNSGNLSLIANVEIQGSMHTQRSVSLCSAEKHVTSWGEKRKWMGEKRESYECKLHKCRMKLNIFLESYPKSDAITFA